MQSSLPFRELGQSQIEAIKSHITGESIPWKALQNPYSKRLTLPLLWSPSEFIGGKIKRMEIEQEKILCDSTALVLKDLANYLPGVPIRIFYAKLLAGDSISTHIDAGGIFNVSHRCHLPIVAPEGITFFCSEDTYCPTEGKWFEINNCLPHSVINTALADRTHLIVDILPASYGYLLEEC